MLRDINAFAILSFSSSIYMLGHEFKRLIGYEPKGDSNLSELLGMSFVEKF